jgi:hypothetical protein
MPNSRLLLLACVALAIGCRGAADENAALDEAVRYAELPGLRATHHKGLQEELARLESERATPLLLDETAGTASSAHQVVTPTAVDAAGSTNARGAVVQWKQFFAPRTVSDVAARLDELYPSGVLEFHPLALRTAVELRTQYEPQRQRFRRLSAQASPPDWRHAQGLLADASYVEVARTCGRLEGLAAAELLHNGQPEAALEAVRQMLAGAESLAAEPRVVSRITAVHARHDALRALAAVVAHPQAGRDVWQTAAALLTAQLERWPHDKLAWIGDRAVGLHTYELVRDGRLLSLLTPEEKLRFRRLGLYDELEESVAAGIDADEMYYLSAMRRLIAACDKPYHQRTALLKAIRGELLDLHGTAQYPLVADTLLLADFEAGLRLQALDRARFEAWLLALRAAISPMPPSAGVNPLTGEPFHLSLDDRRVQVTGIDPISREQVSIPLAASQETTTPQGL